MSKYPIDFVILWVDGNDPAWVEEMLEYRGDRANYANKTNRFRDWGTLQYWFRGVEKYAPWVNNVYFITWGHLPEWLNVNHPKLKIINHKDYIPSEYLPTFNSNTIELNLHRLEGLSEHFVLFNDDVFLLDSVKPDDFFVNGQPRDEFANTAIVPRGQDNRIKYTMLNNVGIINQRFVKRAVIKKMPKKIFYPGYGKELLIKTILTLPWDGFTAFYNPHVAASHLKSTFTHLWELEEEQLDATCRNKFRGLNDLNHWLMRYWNMCTGNFVPRKHSFAHYYNLSDKNDMIYNCIRGRKHKMICINDMIPEVDYESIRSALIDSFDSILPDKSAFEK